MTRQPMQVKPPMPCPDPVPTETAPCRPPWPGRSPDPGPDTLALYCALFRDEPPGAVNVLEFDSCELEGCDCGATIRLGVHANTLPHLLLALQRAGLTVRAVPPPDMSLLPADWRRTHLSGWARLIQVREEAATTSATAWRAMRKYLRRHGVPVTEGK